jgi:hypothetical protein
LINTDKKSLARDCDGAITTIALLMAVCLVGMLYVLRGTGHTTRYKEHIQDTADASAFTASAEFARSMNSIGLSNLTQLAAQTALWAIQLAKANASFCSAGAEYTYPYTECPSLHGKWSGFGNSAGARLPALIDAATTMATTLRDQTPQLAQQRINDLSAGFGDPTLGTVVAKLSMPLKTAPVELLCAKSQLYILNLWQSTINADFLDPKVFQVQPPAKVNPGAPCANAASPNSGPQVMDPRFNQTGVEELQVRALAIGDPESLSISRRGSEILHERGGRDEATPDPDLIAEALSQYAIAQGEYYSEWQHVNTLQDYTDVTAPWENTFHMHWRARLRRVRVPVDGNPAIVGEVNTVQNWVDNELIPACLGVMPEKCSDLQYLAPVLGGALH